MSIEVDEDTLQFALHTVRTTYLMQVLGGRHLTHVYWGRRIHTPQAQSWFTPREVCSFSPNPDARDKRISFDTLPREYPDYGRSDYSSPAFEATGPDGGSIIDTTYHSYHIAQGKTSLRGLPSLYTQDDPDVQTLVVKLRDPVLKLMIELHYTVFEAYDAITRHVVVRNEGTDCVRLRKALSCTVDFFGDTRFDLVHLHGAYARERHMERFPIGNATYVVDSKRGASSHEQNPFLALARPETDQFQGDVYSMNLVYSGSFLGEVCVNSYGKTRMQIGLHPIDFTWALRGGDSFTTPEAVLVFSSDGFNGLSGIYHRLYRERLCRGYWKNRVRPILMNNWEATYFDFDEARIFELIDAGADLGLELFVLDDGWFGQRDSDTTSLGDWFENPRKLPHGLKVLADHAHARGLLFGLWLEPEMVSPRSLLYKEHPDWALHVQQRSCSEGRNQLVLDLSRAVVVDHLFAVISDIIMGSGLDYIKWDMNRNFTEVGSTGYPAGQQKEIAHRYILGLYDLLERLTSRFPTVLFESCAGGGGRFDPGMLYYTPQIWTSDDTDGYERAAIQWGTSLVYPPITMGAHVSAVPNHQVRRITPLQTRGHMAMSANLGYELDITKLSIGDRSIVAQQIARYKALRPTLQFGRFYRLEDPAINGRTSWMIESPDTGQVVLFCFTQLQQPSTSQPKLFPRYLQPSALYQLEDGMCLHGDTLMYFGLDLPAMKNDFDSVMLVLDPIT